MLITQMEVKPGAACRLRTDAPTRVRVIRYSTGKYVMLKRDRNCPEVWYPTTELILC